MPPQEESTLASTARDGDILALDPACSEFDAELAAQQDGASQATALGEYEHADTHGAAGGGGLVQSSLWRSFERSQPGAPVDHVEHLAAVLEEGSPSVVVTCSPVTSDSASPRCAHAPATPEAR